MVYFPGQPNVDRSVSPGYPPPTVIRIKRIARPMVALLRKPGPKTPESQLTFRDFRIGPLSRSAGPTCPSVVCTPLRLKRASRIASTAAIITGRYSGTQPAITALIAIFSIEHGAHFGGIGPITSSGWREVAASILSTRSTVGGTIG